ncbi:MAG: DNA-3-methyladenine glycosylase [Vicinamibacterales bacterium]|nr:DNA-3-methyladenine glycosylase [Vicinamibacterales bacterium]
MTARCPPRVFYRRPTLAVARDLLGLALVHETPAGRTAGLIVEVEAYIGESDPACHAAAGPTPRNEPMYGQPGRAYVYLNYGLHHLVNVVTEPSGVPAAVLIRALEPVEGVDMMRVRRGVRRDGRPVAVHDLCRGPGNLTRAMGIGPAQNRADLVRPTRRRSMDSGGLWIEHRGVQVDAVEWTARIGIRVGLEHAWRCAIAGHACVSGRT